MSFDEMRQAFEDLYGLTLENMREAERLTMSGMEFSDRGASREEDFVAVSAQMERLEKLGYLEAVRESRGGAVYKKTERLVRALSIMGALEEYMCIDTVETAKYLGEEIQEGRWVGDELGNNKQLLGMYARHRERNAADKKYHVP